MTERQLCSSNRAFFNRHFTGIGHVIDYELPLDDKRDSAFGKVDLVSVTDNNELLLLEVKKVDSNEHPLRAMFEIFTFWKILQDAHGCFGTFLKEYYQCQNYKNWKEREENCKRNNPENVCLGLLLYENSDIYKTLDNCQASNSDECDLYIHFMKSPIKMKVFAYDYKEANTLKVQDKTRELRAKLNLELE